MNLKLICVFAVLALLLIVGFLVSVPPPKPSPQAAFVIDNSSSQNTVTCDGFADFVRGHLDTLSMGKHSTVTVFSIGDHNSQYEPVRQTTVNVTALGGAKKGAFQARKLKPFQEAMEKACATIHGHPVPSSAIFRSVQVALEDLNSKLAPDVRGLLVVRSDLEENKERGFFKKAGLAGVLPNNSADVLFCGYAQTSDAGGPRGALVAALIQRWRESFSDPSTVRFSPYCETAPGQ